MYFLEHEYFSAEKFLKTRLVSLRSLQKAYSKLPKNYMDLQEWKKNKENSGIKESGTEEFPNEIVLEVRAGAGGDEASLFAWELAHMYEKFAEAQDWLWKV